MQVMRVAAELPQGLERLVEAAAAEAVRNVGLLVSNWESGAQRFNRDGAALFAVFDGIALAGIGGVRREDTLPEPAMRMHRFYVHPDWRRKGAGRLLAEATITHGLAAAPILTCNAQASPQAGLFWEAMGFVPVDMHRITHIYRI
ncbi:MAG: GNAT family N-acetyltransferase [Alphaproteobacteria bacterium HGW-Alphaproteobacteria-18]|nr:MAG: GNAT family N-acetyltransferase [Alphaproteobacteria bacterium HGW-Alphaproteobacteria-18]